MQRNNPDEIKTSLLVKNDDLNGVITAERPSENEGRETDGTGIKTKVSLERFESSNERFGDISRRLPAGVRNVLSPYDSQSPVLSPMTLSSGIE